MLASALTRPLRAAEAPTAAHSEHLLQARVRGGAAALGGDVDAHYPQSGWYEGVGLGYSYSLPRMDVGAGFDYLVAPADYASRRSFIPSLSLRGNLPLGASVDLGLILNVGWSWTMIELETYGVGRNEHTFSGMYASLGVSCRVWLAPRFALDFGPELVLSKGHDVTGGSVSYFNSDAGMLGLGGFLRGSFAL